MPLVTVEISPPEPRAALAQALLDACSAAVRVGECVLDDPASTEASVAVAIVRWNDGGERQARVEVGMRNTGEPTWSSRNLDFGDTDPQIERWRSVGLTIATLAGEMMAQAERTRASNEPPAPTPKPGPGSSRSGSADGRDAGAGTQPMDSKAARRQTLWIGATGAAGPGLENGGARIGGWADLGFRPFAVPLFLRLSAGFATRPRDPQGLSVQWETVTLGAGGTVGTGRLTLEPRIAASVDAVHAAVVDSASHREDSGTKLGLGIHAGADTVFRVDRFGLVASLDAWHLLTRTDILVKDAPAGVSAANGWALGVGMRFFLE